MNEPPNLISPLILIYDHYAEADAARNALLAHGFDAEMAQLHMGDDEAGPVQGNFTVGNRDTLTGRFERAINALFGSDNHVYRHNYSKTAFRGLLRLVVHVRDAQEQAMVLSIVQAYGGGDIVQRTADCGKASQVGTTGMATNQASERAC